MPYLLLFAAGVTLAQCCLAPPSWMAALACAVLLGCGPWRRHGVWLLALIVGFAWSAWRIEQRLASAWPAQWEGRPVMVTLRVVGLPRQDAMATRLDAVLEHVELSPPLANWPARVGVSDYQRGDWPAGSRWRAQLTLRRWRATSNPHTFAAEAWLMEQGRLASGSVRPGAQRLADSQHPQAWLDRWRAAAVARVTRAAGEHTYSGVLTALITGEQGYIPPEHWRLFAQTGLTHLVSVSGVHLTLLAGLVASVTIWLWRRQTRWRAPPRLAGAVAGLLAASAYGLLAGWSLPTQRSVYMLWALALALCGRYPLGVGRAWALALCAVLTLDPFAALSLGFWLSFFAVGLMIWVGAGRVGALPWWRQWGRAQWAASLAMAVPLLASFGELPWLSPLSNLYAIPLIGSVLTPAALLASALPTDLGVAWVAQALDWAMWPLEHLAGAPMWAQAAPTTLAIALASLGVAVLSLPAGVAGRALGLALCLPLFCPPERAPPPGQAQITVLDVGQGLAVVVRTAQHTLVYDTGARVGASDMGARVIAPFLAGEGVARLDGLVVSHSDMDHAGGAASLWGRFAPGWLLAGEPERLSKERPPVAPQPCRAGQHWQWDGVRFDVLYPIHGGASDNHASCVLRVWAQGQALLLTGDAELADEDAMLAHWQPDALAADVLVVGHHGSRTSSGQAFLQAVRPREAVISAGYRNRYHHPHPAVWTRLADAGARRWRTDRDGALRFTLGAAADIQPEGFRTAQPHWWQSSWP